VGRGLRREREEQDDHEDPAHPEEHGARSTTR
jgi:hypothetical protein